MGRLAKADAVLQAAEEWKRSCLLGGGSVFSEERLWTLDNFRELATHFVVRWRRKIGQFAKVYSTV